mgnify:CR=1 FL=1
MPIDSDTRAGLKTLLIKAAREHEDRLKREPPNYLPKHWFWHKLEKWDNGQPRFVNTNHDDDAPPDYSRAFQHKQGTVVSDEAKACSDFVRSDDALVKRWLRFFEGIDVLSEEHVDMVDKVLPALVQALPGDLVDFCRHSGGVTDEALQRAADLYLAYLFDDHLRGDIWVPILFCGFDTDTHQLSESVEIQRIPEDVQLARASISTPGLGANDCVVSCATHALVFTDCFVKNRNDRGPRSVLGERAAYPRPIIETFFAALRACTCISTGYPQMFMVANGWVSHFKAHLPTVAGVSVREYPVRFDDFWWLVESVPTVGETVLDDVTALFSDLMTLKNKALQLACKRLNQCSLRSDEEDSVLDATIGLEALLNDGKHEMTHKIALRIAALFGLNDPKAERSEVFRQMKKIYEFRSAIAHGSARLEKKREIKLTEETVAPAVQIATDFLRKAIRILAQNPQFLDPPRIDSELLLGPSRR